MPDAATAQGATSRSTARKLVQAAALAAALVPLGSVTADASSLTVTCAASGGFCNGGEPLVFDFGSYKVSLDFFGVTDSFNLTVSDNVGIDIELPVLPPTQEQFDGMIGGSLGTYDCVALVEPTATDSGCRRFTFTTDTGQEPWDGYTTTYAWLFDSENNGFSNGLDPDGSGPLPGLIRVLQAPETSPQFTIDMCLQALTDPAYPPCTYDALANDPTVKSGDTRFSDQIVARAVPEPAGLALLGTGLAGLLYRKRRNFRS